ncbi:hypothetical protein ACRAQ7_03785 [Erythrobacter sp. W53]|uniref:hypothetical protein n=1 Tax=Erythrobacter sp. W53 TaxID=3425947 RepID=UPI003D769626
MRAIIALSLGVLLASCASGGPPRQVIERWERAVANAPGAAQPSRIVATELGFARAAQEQGQWTATLDYAAPGAVLHGRNGPVDAATTLGRLRNPEQSAAWSTRTVVMSCDGALAVSQGRFMDAERKVGNYVTVWKRQSDGSYRWQYDVAGRDDPQPAPRVEPDIPEGAIVVEALDTIRGLVADCTRGREVPPPPALSLASEHPQNAVLSRDGTLRWRWEHRPDGIKYVAVDFYSGGKWQTPLEEALTSPPAG